MKSIIDQVLADIEAIDPPTLPSGDLPASPSGRRGKRKLESHQRTTITIDPVTLEEGQHHMLDAAMAYLELDKPAHAMLFKAQAGTGKTYLGVKLALYAANVLGWRVLYIGPRHDFFDDLMNEVAKQGGNQSQWFHWLPRQRGDEATGKIETCRHEPYMATWLHRGYEAMDFCERFCGWDYIRKSCLYHAQKEEAKPVPIIFCQHQHLTTGHPLMESAKLIIGDESPLGAFPDNWAIPAKWVVPNGMPYDEPLTELLYKLQALTVQTEDKKRTIHGRELLALLGGMETVKEACEMLDLPEVYEKIMPNVWHPSEVDTAPFWHLPDLTSLLIRECEAAAASEKDYVSRVRLVRGKLNLLRRASVSADAPYRIIWFDATANDHLYKTILQRPIEVIAPPIALQGNVYQVYESLNNRSKLIKQDGALEPAKIAQIKLQIQTIIQSHGYTNPLIISHLPLEESFSELGQTGHFGGERGTNRFEQCDVAFIVGAQQPSVDDVKNTAAMVYQERMTQFRGEWQEKDIPFVNHPHSYLVSGFYGDDDLQALLWQSREAEIIQAAHRVRPVRRPVDVWLLTNIPIAELPPTRLVSIAEIFGAPESVDPYKWHDLVSIADMSFESGEALSPSDLVELIGVSEPTARKYLAAIVEHQPDRWERDAIKPKGGKAGRPTIGIIPRQSPLIE